MTKSAVSLPVEDLIRDEHVCSWSPISDLNGWDLRIIQDSLTYMGLVWQNGYHVSDVPPLWCASAAYRNMGRGLFPNNVAFYAEGVEGSIQRLKLTVNVNDADRDKDAAALLDDAADLLVDAVLGRNVGDTFRGHHLAPGSRISMAGFWFETSIEFWPSGKGWSRRFVIRVPSPVAI